MGLLPEKKIHTYRCPQCGKSKTRTTRALTTKSPNCPQGHGKMNFESWIVKKR